MSGESYRLGGDLIVSAAGTPVTSEASLRDVIQTMKPGDTLSLEIWRGDKKETVSVKLGCDRKLGPLRGRTAEPSSQRGLSDEMAATRMPARVAAMALEHLSTAGELYGSPPRAPLSLSPGGAPSSVRFAISVGGRSLRRGLRKRKPAYPPERTRSFWLRCADVVNNFCDEDCAIRLGCLAFRR